MVHEASSIRSLHWVQRERTAVSGLSDALGSTHPITIHRRRRLITRRVDSGELSMAVEEIRALLAEMAAWVGTTDPSTVDVQADLADLLEVAGAHDEALSIREELDALMQLQVASRLYVHGHTDDALERALGAVPSDATSLPLRRIRAKALQMASGWLLTEDRSREAASLISELQQVLDILPDSAT